MIRQAPNRFNPAQLIKTLGTNPTGNSADSGSEGTGLKGTGSETARFRVIADIGDFKRLAQLVADYRLSDAVEDDSPDLPGELNGSSKGSAKGSADTTGFEAVFKLSRFADSSFIFDANEQVAKPGTSLPGGGNGGGSEERAAKTPIIVAEGVLEAVIELQCQRCLGSYDHRIETSFKFAFAANEITADLLPDTMDPVLLDEDGNITVVDMFEDELLLRLPTHAVHSDESLCDFTSVPYRDHVANEEQLKKLAEESKPENPFASLKGMTFSADKPDEFVEGTNKNNDQQK